ncbi:MAG: molecular chaperone DnaJ [Sphingomonas bacterium]|nr:molecular chaperone DnaJ [Sphingomonas bacterium]MDB5717389.1 molecular chaperone DnaJ [Sphingomonas bacterium]
MSLILLIAAVIGVWAWRNGQLRALRFGDIAAVIAALCGVRLLGHGQMPIGILAIAGAAGWAWLRTRSTPAARPTAPEPATVTEARSLLELPPGADRAAIESAHRRLIGRVHPDAGGSTELARRVNGARDLLIAELNRRAPRAS